MHTSGCALALIAIGLGSRQWNIEIYAAVAAIELYAAVEIYEQ